MSEQTITPTIDLKKRLREVIIEVKNNVQKKATQFIQQKTLIENEHDKYFNELRKHSDLFEIIKTEKTEKLDVNIYQLDEYGNTDHLRGSTTIDIIEVNYYDCHIYVPKNKLPMGFPNVNLTVEEHTTNSRRGWRTTNHGYKMKFSLGWTDEKYYKTGRVIVKQITDRLESIKLENERRNSEKQFDDTVHVYMVEKYGNDNIRKECMHTYTINLQNGITIGVYVRRCDGWVFKPENIKIQSVNFDPSKFSLEKAYESLKSI